MTAAGALVSQRSATGMAMRGMVMGLAGCTASSAGRRMAWRRRGMKTAARSSE